MSASLKQSPTTRGTGGSDCVIDVSGLRRTFGLNPALASVSLMVGRGEIHALLGPNGAGKSTLLRILCGLVEPTAGTGQILGRPPRALRRRDVRKLIGLVPSGDRSFYQRLSGLENLVFFGRMHGLGRQEALKRAESGLASVGLTDAGTRPVGTYSHGMQKRLSVARALLTDPALLLVDEATHDLDPEGARRVQELVAQAAAAGAAVVWATQRLDEIRSFANAVTLLDGGEVRFAGTVPQLMALCEPRRYILRLRAVSPSEDSLLERAGAVLDGAGTITRKDALDSDHYLLQLHEGSVLGDALTALIGGGVEVRGCSEERSEIETSFLLLTHKGAE
jgi:ABC-2 type transport system ATP-binding protein